MAKIDTVVVGASAGGVEALSHFVGLLSADLPAALFVVLHFPGSSTSVLPSILGRAGPLPARHAKEGEVPQIGTIYVAPPGRHMLLHNGAIRLVVGPKENGHRPAIDPLFRTAAHSNRNRVISALLSGLLDDGTLGSWAVRRHGGRTLCQDPAEAAFGDMPRNAIEYGAMATIVLDAIGRLAHANERTRTTFGLHPRDIGRPFQDLELSYRSVELRSGIEQAKAQKRPVTHRDVMWTSPGGASVAMEVRLTPLTDERRDIIGVLIAFEDVTQFKRLQTELTMFNQELETAYEEVQSTNEELQTTNEELQSTVEELETTNEELQSTNEELETMNEELQSANEELETINEELRDRSLELNRANSFLESVLAGLSDGVIVLDADLQVLAWNYGSEDLWGLRGDEVIGKHLFNLDIGLPVESLRAPIRACLANREAQRLELGATNRRSRSMACRVVCTPLHGALGEVRGVIVLTACDAA